jgi:chitodextrinase
VSAAAATKRTVLAVVASVLMLVAVSIAGPAGGARSDRISPTEPTQLRVTGATPTSVAIAWQPSRDNVGIAGYRVVRDGRGTMVSRPAHVVRGLACGTAIAVSITALDRSGNASQSVRVIGATSACFDSGPPSPPSGFLQAATSERAVVLRWSPSVDDVGVVAYGVYRQASLVSSTFEPSVTLSGLSCGTVEAVSVDAVDAAGNRSARRTVYAETAACPLLQPLSATNSSSSSEWTGCAEEGGQCAFSGIGDVRYGANGVWTNPRSFSGGVPCTNRVFGDPLYGVPKRCEVRSTGSVNAPPPASTWASCAVEGNRCSFADTREVRYGANGRWTNPRTFTGGVPCTNAVFGDPIYGVLKSCESRSAGRSVTPPTPPADTSPPAMPRLSLGEVTKDSAVLNWQPGTDDVGIDHYNVWLDSARVAETTALSHRYTELRCGTDYVLGLEAVDAAGNKSVLAQAQWPIRTRDCTSSSSSPPADVSPPSTPPNLRLSDATSTSVGLTWSASTDNVGVAGYRVERNGASDAAVTERAATVDGLTCGTAYTFGVKAFDAAGNQSPPASVIGSTSACADTQPPTAPTNPIATSRTATSIALSWTAASDNVGVTGYGLYRGGVRTATTSATNGVFAGLTCNTNYTLAVDAYDAAGHRSPQVAVMVSTTACPDTTPPSAPTGLASSNVSQTSVTLTWSPSTDNVGVTAYDVFRNGAHMATVSGRSIAQGELECGTSYLFAVAARDAAGNSSPRAQVDARTAVCTPPPAPPSGWTTVASENEVFTLTTNKEVRYGKDPTWSTSRILGPGSYRCDNATFGDPFVGTQKQCQARPTTQQPAPPPPPPTSGSVKWPAPTLTNPTTVQVSNSNNRLYLSSGQDYIIRMPSTPLTATGGLWIIGGRNVVLVGGEIFDDTPISSSESIDNAYGLYLKEQTGTVHIEGLWIHGRGIGQTIAMQQNSGATVQVQNCRLEALHPVGHVHTDTIQSWAGPRTLRLYQSTLISNGVVIQVQPREHGYSGSLENWHYERLDLVHQTAATYALNKSASGSPFWPEYHKDLWLKTDPTHHGASQNSAGVNWSFNWPGWNPGGNAGSISGEAINVGHRPGGQLISSSRAGIGYSG